MDFSMMISQYGGWVGLLLYFLYHQFWPFIAKRSVSDHEFEQLMEERRVTADEQVAAAVRVLSENMVMTNERIATIQSNQLLLMQKQNDTHDMLASAISDMRATVGRTSRRGKENEE